MRKFYFNNIDDLINHLFYKYGELSPLKLQKSLYFLFAFYSGNYQAKEKEGVTESSYSDSYPKYLFDANFEAWNYGPVIKEVYKKNKAREYNAKEFKFDLEAKINIEINKFINDVSEMIINKSDFALVDRSHEDYVWKNSFKNKNSKIMKKEDIENEYRKIFQSI
ncbi:MULTISPECIES: Panacea domain-containing protein [unclassified Gemella]|uniref:Panacea domain-containing protein n=1 Tax=unclassified Gemella TaxID=2624949 RepID=UPI001C0475FB|nr:MULTISPECIES: type II toxin-antitoxin system antitoxin SocA domain-containing protein [unclassified Gemella]MBU0279297.1 DUF4065 domain-containing protein [Gemella sp. zg-1178]QWQ39142.1 DUF4065 domain-containing protein [Gemella sp. zg-570]